MVQLCKKLKSMQSYLLQLNSIVRGKSSSGTEISIHLKFYAKLSPSTQRFLKYSIHFSFGGQVRKYN